MAAKKLLIASDCFLPRWDGVARFLAELIPKIKDDYKITVVAPDFDGSRIRIQGIEIVRVPTYSFRWGDFPPAKFSHRTIKRLVKENDIIFCQSIGPVGMLAILAGKKFRKPVISFIHSIEWELVPKSASKVMFVVRYEVKKIAKWLYNKATLLLLPSEDTADVLREAGIKTTMHVIHLGVDTKRFSPPESKDAAKKKIGIGHESLVIGYTGRIGREKDLKTLYKAFRSLKEKYGNMKDIKLLIVGKGLGLKDIFDSLDDVVHVPVSNSIQDYLRAMDIFVLPSLTETSSLATMEAMASGLPVVTTGVGYLKEYIKDGKNGYIFPKKDHRKLAEKIDKLIVNPDLRKAIGSMARKTIQADYPWENTAREIKKVLDRF
ncbi:hypothetical protein COV19_03225 [Candidatus Woesearchaeota archaeon CG10_big_fil_rev_8_21_14_0_10_44_13]|nr:MAG: hypothetical protein COV19_03225 [Candidatus Woesearchaeota archaeon CG10_big_fil_rev_8_21_14_0_10_44_13]